MNRAEVDTYVYEEYGVKPSYLWKKYPEDYTFRHKGTNRWFGLIMTIEKRKIGINDVGRILRTFKIKKNVEVTDNGKIII